MIRHWLQLALTEGIGPILIRRILDAAGGAEQACAANATLLQTIEGIGRVKASHVAQALKRAGERVDQELEQAVRSGVELICPDDPSYPPLLKHVPDPPPILYLKGSLQPRDLNALAIVGSRKCSFYGREQAERFAALLAGAAITVVSGGARGIDSSAHRGALSHPQGRTIAVLGSGVDVAYPPENKVLFEQIAQDGHGAVLSEYPLRTPPMAENFPRRNRIVSGMSRGVLVIEADEKSGALITARQACEDHGRPVFALPGRVDQSTSSGPHRLIREGAALVTCLEDILDGLEPLPQAIVQPTLFEADADDLRAQQAAAREGAPVQPALADDALRATLNQSQRIILAQLGADPVDVDALIERTALPAHQVLQELTYLSLKGLVRRLEGQTFALRR